MTRGVSYPVETQPIARMGTPADVAQAAVFFASQMSNFATGQTLNVDGGVLLD
jgi:3-oxoacyl-[acyl-carrier protein] reductase